MKKKRIYLIRDGAEFLLGEGAEKVLREKFDLTKSPIAKMDARCDYYREEELVKYETN